MVKDVSKVQSNENIETRSKQRDWTPRDLVTEKGRRVNIDGFQQENIRFHCNKCAALYIDKIGFNKHIKIIHEGIKYNCSQCDPIFTQQSNPTCHIKTVYGGVKYDCNQCDY